MKYTATTSVYLECMVATPLGHLISSIIGSKHLQFPLRLVHTGKKLIVITRDGVETESELETTCRKLLLEKGSETKLKPKTKLDHRRWIGGIIRNQKEVSSNLHSHELHGAFKIYTLVQDKICDAVQSITV